MPSEVKLLHITLLHHTQGMGQHFRHPSLPCSFSLATHRQPPKQLAVKVRD